MLQEEEDDYIEDESDVDNADSANTHPEARNQSIFNKKWRQAVVKAGIQMGLLEMKVGNINGSLHGNLIRKADKL